jgi:protein TonB
MITRYLSSATAGAVVTTGLLYVMQMLIASGEQVWTETPRGMPIVWRHVDPFDDSDIPPPPPEPPPLPLEPPLSAPPADGYPLGGSIGIPSPAPPPPAIRRQNTGFSMGDGPLATLYRVSPVYPMIAERKGLEGFVTVRFDVNELGAVENVVVVESSNAVFNKSAVAATYRFKFKPRIFDGEPRASSGLQNLFRYRMPER